MLNNCREERINPHTKNLYKEGAAFGEGIKELLAPLNKQQTEAVTHGDGPLLVIAGAGTGKTSVIIRRIAHLIASQAAKPGEILALTFTDKAAEEMEARVDQLVPYGYIDVSLSTFHAFGDRVLKEYALNIGYPNDYSVLSAAEQLVFLREHVFQLPLKHYRSLSDPTRYLSALLNIISRAQDEDISPDKYLSWAKGKRKKVQGTRQKERDEEAAKQLEVAEVYAKYQELKKEKGLVDFADQVGLTLQLFRKYPSILKKFQKRYKYILVDEFQDTNYSQFELLKLLAGKKANLMVVGDDDQSIYKFRGAAISNILGFSKTYKKAKLIVLTQNYRSTQPILDTSRRLIKHNDPDRLEIKEGVDKKLIAAASESQKVVVHKHFDKLLTEADWVARTIFEKHSQGYKYADFAILVRANAHAEAFVQSLNMLGIPFQFSGGGGLYTQRDVKFAISFLRTIGDLSDSLSLSQIAISPVYSLPSLDLQKMNAFAKRRNMTLYHVFSHLEDGGEQFKVLNDIPKDSRDKVQKIVDDICYYLEYASQKATGEVLYHFLKRSAYLSTLVSQVEENDGRIRALGQFFERIREFKEVAELDRVSEFIKHLNILKDAGENPETVNVDSDMDAVSILTVHKAKGLEFRVVFLVSLVVDRFPVRSRKDPIELPAALLAEDLPKEEFHVQEERRLFYVGMTRAKEELYLTSAADYGGLRQRKISRFVLEALDIPRADITYSKKTPSEQIELFAPLDIAEPTLNFKINDDQPLHLSFYQIDDYMTCPLKYKFVHLLRVPLLPNHQIIYGSALHNAVQVYSQAKLNGKEFSEKNLLEVLDHSWSSEGFISREHEEQRLKNARLALSRWYKAEQKSERTIKFVEEEFSIPKDNNIIIRGRWDRVDELKDNVHIVDFKTSEVFKQEDADKKAKNSLQLSLYALVWKEKFGELPHKVELSFLESGLVGSVSKDEKNVDKTMEKIRKVAHGIRCGEFEAKPNAFTCKWCAYSELCPARVS